MVVGTVRKKYEILPVVGLQWRRTDADIAKVGKPEVGSQLEKLHASRQEEADTLVYRMGPLLSGRYGAGSCRGVQAQLGGGRAAGHDMNEEGIRAERRLDAQRGGLGPRAR